MIELEPTDGGVTVRDHANVEVTVEATEWAVTDADATVPRPTDETIAARASELRLPSDYVIAKGLNGDEQFELGNDTGPLELPDDEYVVDIATPIKTYLRFEGPATLTKSDDFDDLVFSFPSRRAVTFGFRSLHERPAGTITVEPTPEGVATGLSNLHSAIKTTSPDRSFPTLRGHPPRVETGEATAIPDHVADGVAETGIELVTPPSVDYLYVLAPLSYYLQASVSVEDVDRPELRAPAADLSTPLPVLPELQTETAELLRHCFYLDCLVRNLGPHGTDLVELAVLEDLGFDAERAYQASPPERLATYLDVPRAAIEDHIPEWHLATYVEPDTSRARSLPFLLDKMSLVHLPETSELSGSELLEHSLDDFYRSQDDVADVDVVKPNLKDGRVHAWLADGIPIDVFKVTHDAFENRLDYLERGGDGMEVTVVLNDEGMESEHDDVARIYSERAEELPMDVTVHEFLQKDELAAVLEEKNDFVHYIGHCERTGLRCPDGNMAVAEIEESNTQTFFLNACGSYYEGMKLLEKGSVVGAVTLKEVLDKQAATVGTAFARLLVHGFSFARAVQLARRRIMTGKDYAVVGDGTHSLTQGDSVIPMLYRLDEGPDTYNLTAEVFAAWQTGGIYYVALDEAQEQKYLCGNDSSYRIERNQLIEFLGRSSRPILYDGNFYWTNDLRDEIL